MTGPIFVFQRIHPLPRDTSSLRGNAYSRHDVFIWPSRFSSSIVKKCPLPKFSQKLASEHSLFNFWYLKSSPNFCSCTSNKFTQTDTDSVSIRKFGRNSNWLPILIFGKFLALGECLANSVHNSFVDNDQIDRNKCAKNQFNSIITSVELNRFLYFSLLLNPPLSKTLVAQYTECPLRKVERPAFSSFLPFSVRFVSMGFKPFLPGSKHQKWPTSARESTGRNYKFVRIRNAIFCFFVHLHHLFDSRLESPV